MKPTIDSIKDAFRGAEYLNSMSHAAMLQLSNASMAVLCTSPKQARERLTVARRNLVTLRRTQTAALANIDEALKSLT